jgi:hypothetical protein
LRSRGRNSHRVECVCDRLLLWGREAEILRGVEHRSPTVRERRIEVFGSDGESCCVLVDSDAELEPVDSVVSGNTAIPGDVAGVALIPATAKAPTWPM